jgi:hypothetical protein
MELEWQSSIVGRHTKIWQSYQRGRFSQIYVYKPDMKYKSLMNLVYLWLHNENPI